MSADISKPGWYSRNKSAFLSTCGLLVVTVGVKCLLLAAEPKIRFFLGDSGSYIYSALTRWAPPDRSYYYPLLIRLAVGIGHTLYSLVILQVFLSAMCCLLLAVMLRQFFGARWLDAGLVGFICALEPIQLYYERFVLTETGSLFALAVYVYFCLSYMKNRRLVTLFYAVIVGYVMIKLRSVFAVVYLAGIFLAVIKAPVNRLLSGVGGGSSKRTGRPGRMDLIHCLVAVILVSGVLIGGKYAERRYWKLPNHSDVGFFVLAAWSPILADVDIPFGPDLKRILRGMPCNLSDWEGRGLERWRKGCLVSRLRKSFANLDDARTYSLKVGTFLLFHHPLRVIQLSLASYVAYMNLDVLSTAAEQDRALGQRRPDRFRAEISKHFGMNVAEFPEPMPVLGSYFGNSGVWCLIITSLPLWLGVIMILARTTSWELVFLWVLYSLHLGVIVTLATEVNIRYLHPLAWCALLILGAVWAELAGSREDARIAGRNSQ